MKQKNRVSPYMQQVEPLDAFFDQGQPAADRPGLATKTRLKHITLVMLCVSAFVAFVCVAFAWLFGYIG